MIAHWFVEEPAPATPEPVVAVRSPIERIAEIFEALFLLTAELLVELDRADTATLIRLFGVSAPPAAEPALAELPAKPGPM
jgi:hypothetical protein